MGRPAAALGADAGGANGQSITSCRATREAQRAEQTLPSETYVLVLEGCYVIHMNGQDLPFAPGGELMIPEGLPVHARVVPGTQRLFARDEPAG